MADVEQDGATVLLGAGGSLVRTLRASLHAVLLIRGDTILQASRALVNQDDSRFGKWLDVIAFFITRTFIIVDTQLILSEKDSGNPVDVTTTFWGRGSTTASTVASTAPTLSATSSKSSAHLLVFGLPQEDLDLLPVIPLEVAALPASEKSLCDIKNVFQT